MNIAIDIGNTRVKAGVFINGRLRGWQAWQNWKNDDLLAFATNHNARNVILSSVAGELAADLRQRLSAHFRYLELQADTPVPIQNHYRTPQTLGRDRLAAVVGAYSTFPGQACLIVDAGTCITYDFLRADGVYPGGNISPGIRMRLRAMHAFTASLPLVEAGALGWVGDSTETALRNGAQAGALLEAEGYISHATAEYGEVKVIFTGGDAEFFAKNLKSKIFVNHHLVLEGLNQILEYNVKRLE